MLLKGSAKFGFRKTEAVTRPFARRCLCVVLLLVLSIAWTAISALAANSKLTESEIRSALQNKVFTLRQPYAADRLRFDQNGTLQGNNFVGPWTLDAVVEITKVSSKHGSLEIVGNRLYVSYSGLQANYARSKRRITMVIPWNAAAPDALQDTLARIFLTNTQTLADCAPDYWKPYLTDHAEALKQLAQKAHDSSTHTVLLYRQNVYVVGSGVIPPRGTSTPDPKYSAEARSAKVEGTVVLLIVVNEAGKAVDPFILHPVGMGLDDQAVETVRKWQFNPAIFQSKPVPVLINVEVNFRLY